MTKYLVVKKDLKAGIKHYETEDGTFSKNMSDAALFTKKTAENHTEGITKAFNRYMKERIAVEFIPVADEVCSNDVY